MCQDAAMEITTTKEEQVSNLALTNSVRIAACITRRTNDGMTLRSAIREASEALGISEAAVCAALTVAQDFVSDIRDLQAA